MGAFQIERPWEPASAFNRWLIRQRINRSNSSTLYPCVNIRDGEIVGTDGPDVMNGTYVRIDALPSDGGEVFSPTITGGSRA